MYIFLQKLSLDYTERDSRPRKLRTPMSYLVDHTACRGKDIPYIRYIH